MAEVIIVFHIENKEKYVQTILIIILTKNCIYLNYIFIFLLFIV